MYKKMNEYISTDSEAFKTVVASTVSKQHGISFIEDPDKQEAVNKADGYIKKILNKKIWTAQEAGKVYFYDYLILVNTRNSRQSSYESQSESIINKLKQFCSTYPNPQDKKVYDLYSDLFGWLIFVYQRGFGFLKELHSNCVRLNDIIKNAYNAELVAKEVKWQSLSSDAKFGLCNLMITDVFYGDKKNNTKQEEVKSVIKDLKTSINNLAYHRLVLEIVGDYADIQELKYFSFIGRLHMLINDLLSNAEKLKEMISSNDRYGNKSINSERSQTIKSILIDRLQPNKIMPSNDNLIDGTCHSKFYRKGFDISIEIAYERGFKKA
jgi:hypothetical protein